MVLDYLFLDASFFPMHPGSPAEPVLAAWGITTEGKPAFIGLAPGSGESADAWHDFLADLKDRGLASPLLIISDGAPGLISAIEQAYPKALRQRCLVHRCRNIFAKIPAGMQAEVKDAYWAIFHTEDLKTLPGPRLVEIIDHRIDDLAARYRALYPAAVKCLLADRVGLTAYLRFPAEHHHRIRHSNFIVISSPAADVRDVADEQVSAPHLRSGRGYLWPVQHAASGGFGVRSAGGRERLAA